MKSNSKETNRIKEPAKFTIKFANTVFMSGILFSVLVEVCAVYKIYTHLITQSLSSTLFYYSCLLVTLLTSILFYLGLRRLPNKLKVNMSVLFVTVFILVYGFETYLEYFYKNPQFLITKAEEIGVPFDTRTDLEALEDLRDSDSNAYPNVSPRYFIKSNGLKTVKGRIYPFGWISNITTILRNELGYFPIVKTDEHGFINPKGLYQANKVDIVLTGDSYTEGCYVKSDEAISAVIRKSGFNTISLGKSGNGPLIEFSALKEYAEPLKPKIVLWLYSDNDLMDLNSEMESSFLLKYLNENDFTQNLISRQEEIDSLFKKLSKNLMLISAHESIIKLNNLRQILSSYYHSLLDETQLLSNRGPQQEIFKIILQQTKKIVSMWDGEMYFVYLPHIIHGIGDGDNDLDFIMQTVTDLDIPIIDIQKEVFDPHSDPLSLIPFRMKGKGHYTADGYRLVAETIINRLKTDGITPLNSKK